MSWSSYWARVWEPRQLGGRHTPPRDDADEERRTAVPRALPAGRGRAAARHAAAARLQRLLGNRAVARMARPMPGVPAVGAGPSDVRVQHDPDAAAAVGARAFATRDRIVVGDPAAIDDPVLMAAEATHVAQARIRGTRPGISEPHDASERAAHAGARPSFSGGPVPEIQRQEEEQPAASIGRLRPQVVLTMLEIQFASATSTEGGLAWSSDLEAAFGRLLSDVDIGRIRAAWDPPPPSAGVAFLRLVDAGIFPTLRPAPPGSPPAVPEPAVAAEAPPAEEAQVEAEAPAEAPVGAETEIAVRPSRAMGISGISIRVATPPPPPPEAVVALPFLQRGIRLTDAQLRSAIASRDAAIRQFSRLLQAVPGLDEATRTALAMWLADLATTSSARAEARATRPVPIGQDATATAGRPRSHPPSQLAALPKAAPLPQLLDSLAGSGATVTIHFEL